MHGDIDKMKFRLIYLVSMFCPRCKAILPHILTKWNA